MAIPVELLDRLAREYLGRSAVDPEVLADVAQRLAGLLARLRAASEEALQAVPPPTAFAPDHPVWSQAPARPPAPWAGMAAGVGGTGYGGPAGTTGVGAALLPPPLNPEASPGPEFLWWSVADLAAAIRRRDLLPVEVVRAALDRIAALDPVLNAFVTVTVEAALAEARAAEAAALRGDWAGPLHGVPVATAPSWAPPATPGGCSTCRAGPAAGRARRWPRAWCPWPWAPTRAVPSACPRPPAAPLASSPPTVG